MNSKILIGLLILIAILLCVCIYLVISQNSASHLQPSESPSYNFSPQDKWNDEFNSQKNQPCEFLEIKYSWWKNLIEQVVVEATITNIAKNVSYQNIRCKIEFRDKFNRLLYTKDVIWYEVNGWDVGKSRTLKQKFSPDVDVNVVNMECEDADYSIKEKPN